MGMDKLLWPLLGMPVLLRSIHAFVAADCIDSIIVVCPAERWNAVEPSRFSKPIVRVDGGTERQHSVANGLAAVPAGNQLVAIHDAARPLVHPEDIQRCVAAATTTGAATLAHRIVETVKRSDPQDFCEESVNRENLWAMETPQVFSCDALREACAAVASRGLAVTDEVSAAQAIGLKTKFIESRHPNLKITHPADLALAEALLTTRTHP